MKQISFIILIFIIISCSETNESRYSDYQALKQSGRGNQSWFPDFISDDCSEFKEIHNIDNNNTFGRFKYSTNRIVRMFDTSTFKTMSWIEFQNYSLAKKNPKLPKWFIDYDQGVNFYKYQEYLFALDTSN